MLARNRTGGFTLVEILIVVVILGILAAIVIPQFTTASDAARASSLTSQLQTIRSQLELFNVQHAGVYPTLAQMQAGADDWEILTLSSDVTGDTGAAVTPFGPYLQKAPGNPFMSSSLVVAAGAPAAATGWTYDESTGVIKGILPATADATELGLDASDYETAP